MYIMNVPLHEGIYSYNFVQFFEFLKELLILFP
jgi:hypothetical protein